MKDEQTQVVAARPEHRVYVLDMSRDGLLAVSVRPSAVNVAEPDAPVPDGEGAAGG
jgi:hypothetical protein